MKKKTNAEPAVFKPLDDQAALTLAGVWLTVPRGGPFRSGFSLREISTRFRLGHSTAVFGACGSGKSLLLRMLAGQLHPQKGAINLENRPITAVSRLNFGFVPAWGDFPQDLTPQEWLEVCLQVYGCGPKSHRQTMILGALELWELKSWASRRIGQCPPHVSKALAWAAATAHSPDIVIADEPLMGCDTSCQGTVKEWIGKHRAAKKTFIFAARSPEETVGWSDGFLVIRGGEIVLSKEQKVGAQAAAKMPGSRSFQVEVSGLDRERADGWRKNFALPLWENFSLQGFLARLVFQAEGEASQWLSQAVKSNMVVLNYGAVNEAPEREFLEGIRPFLSPLAETPVGRMDA